MTANPLIEAALAELAGVKDAIRLDEQKPQEAPPARTFREAVVRLDDARAQATKRAQAARGNSKWNP